MSFDRVQKSASSTPASRENSAVSIERKLKEPSASRVPEISAKLSPMTTAQWLQSDLVMRTMQGFERKEAENSAPARSDQNASSVQLESLEQPESEAEEQVQTKAADSAPARSDQNASSVQLEALEQPESDSEEQVQTKLTVGKPGDPYEQEADSMAAKVMAMPESAVQESIQRQNPLSNGSEPNSPTNSHAPAVQRSATGEEAEIQMKSGTRQAADGSIQASKSIESRLADSQGGGSPLPQEVRGFMEPRFGADFSNVKVHSDSNAVQMNKELGAQAFARGSDIYYGAGKSPGSNELTAHELTHTIQQTGGKQLSASPTVSLRSNKETFQGNSIAPPSLDTPTKTLPEPEKSPPESEKTTPSQPEQKTTPPAAPQPEKAENANAPEKQNGFGMFEQLGQVKAIAGKLQSVLSGAGGVIWSIVKDPVGFLGNLVAGLRQGFGNFYANVNTHLQTGLMGWLTGTLGPMGIQIPEDVFSLKGAFSMVTQVLGVTWDYIRTKAVKQFGERTVARMEKSSEIFQMLAKGPMGLWEQAAARFDDLKETTIDQIKNTIATQVIQAGIKWMMSLLNPASGLVKAAFAIYDIVTFFTQRASSVVELAQAATGAVAAVASGSVGGAASMVENALARSIPVAIGFMASLLGINGLATKVQEIVKKVRVRVDGAIDGVLLKAKDVFLKEKVKGNKDKSILDSKDDRDSQVSETSDLEHDRKVTVGLEQLHQEQARYLKNDAIAKEDAQKVAAKVKAENPVFKSITVADNKETWDYAYVASPLEEASGAKKAEKNSINPEKETEKVEKQESLDGKSPEELVKAAGSIWKEVKKRYLKDTTTMKRITDYRKQEVARITALVKQNLNADFNSLIAGSDELTSDYDVTFDAGKNSTVEIQAVKEFNRLFRLEWGKESGTVFDTNVYTTGHMPPGVGELKIKELNQLKKQLENAPPGQKRALILQIAQKKSQIRREARKLQKDNQSETQEQLTKGSEKAYVATLDVMSLIKIRRFMTDQEWHDYTKYMLNLFDDKKDVAVKVETKRRLREANQIYKDAQRKLDSRILVNNNEEVEIIGEGFNKQVKGFDRRSKGKIPAQQLEYLEKRVQEIKDKNLDAEMQANNRLYEDYLDEVEKILTEIEKTKRQWNNTEDEKTKLNQLTLNLQKMRSIALVFANEAYHTGGAVEAVVLNQQLDLKLPLRIERYLESINENTGFFVEQIEHNEDLGTAFWKSGKYLERICYGASKIKLKDFNPPSKNTSMLKMSLTLMDIKKEKNDYKGKYKENEQKSIAQQKSEDAVTVAAKEGYTSKESLRKEVLELNLTINAEVRKRMRNKYTGY